MDELNKYIIEYTTSGSAGVPKFYDNINDLLCLSQDDLLALTSEECFAKSFKISGYAMYIRSQTNENQSRLNWCEDVINRFLAKEWDNYRDSFMNIDVKRQAIIYGNSFLERVEKLRSRLRSRATILEDKLFDIRKMADTLNELGRKKSYGRY